MPPDEPLRGTPALLARIAWPLRLGVVGALVAGAGIPLLGPRWTTALVALLVGSLAWVGWHLWFILRGPGAVMAGLEQRWLGLHGARAVGRCRVAVHDGMQPLEIRVGRERDAFVVRVTTPLPESMLTFRLWPAELPSAPDFTGSATRERDQDLARAHETEALFAMLFKADSNAPSALRRIMTPELMAPLLVVRRESPPGALRGITFDGRDLAIHWSGAIAADPERALGLSRPIWRALVDAS